MKSILVALLVSGIAVAQQSLTLPSALSSNDLPTTHQNLPDAPSAVKRPAKPSAWKFQWKPWDDQLEERTFKETLRSPWFIVPFVTLLAVNAADIEATRASGCGEAQEFGRRPSRTEQYATDFGADLAVAGFAFAAHKLRFSYIPQGLLGYGIVVHSRGLARGLNAHCR